jgi:hypothetical protein
MWKALSNKLEVFLHHNIWRILRVSMMRRTDSQQTCPTKVYDIPRVGNMIATWQLDFLGKTVRGPHDRPAQQMLTACCDNV